MVLEKVGVVVEGGSVMLEGGREAIVVKGGRQ